MVLDRKTINARHYAKKKKMLDDTRREVADLRKRLSEQFAPPKNKPTNRAYDVYLKQSEEDLHTLEELLAEDHYDEVRVYMPLLKQRLYQSGWVGYDDEAKRRKVLLGLLDDMRLAGYLYETPTRDEIEDFLREHIV